ncbi:fimbrial protein [Zymobacter sp. IVIA_5232.4 C2]|uniref:fimbrial protein n=1 Tax=Zymobacter sp. IVIA_5232.4 C2 TaxID=3394855 RepID=UPI0039C2EE1C
MECVETSSGVSDPPPIPVEALAIPSNVPKGTKVWESDPIHVSATCDNPYYGTDSVFFYFNPKKMSLGNGLKMGVSYNGQDLEEDGQRMSTGSKTLGKGENITVSVDFRLYIKVAGTAPSSGYYDGGNQFTVFQLDGRGGINTNPGARNLKYTLSNLRSIRFLACGADLSVEPSDQEVNFGTLMQRNLVNGNKYQRPFSIRAQKQQGCSDNFSLKAEFLTTNSLFENNSINLGNGTQLRLLDENQQPVTYNEYQPFAEPNNVQSVTRNYNAEVSQRSGQSITLGAFQATTIVKVTYY